MRDRESDKGKRMKEIHEEGKAGFQPSMEFCLPLKTLLPKRAFFFLSAHFLLVLFPKLIVVFSFSWISNSNISTLVLVCKAPIPFLSFWIFYFHFSGQAIQTHILFTLPLSRYSMFPYCFLCWNSQRKASQLASALWALLRQQSASRPQRLSLFLHLEAPYLPLSRFRSTGPGLFAMVSFFSVFFFCCCCCCFSGNADSCGTQVSHSK